MNIVLSRESETIKVTASYNGSTSNLGVLVNYVASAEVPIRFLTLDEDCEGPALHIERGSHYAVIDSLELRGPGTKRFFEALDKVLVSGGVQILAFEVGNLGLKIALEGSGISYGFASILSPHDDITFEDDGHGSILPFNMKQNGFDEDFLQIFSDGYQTVMVVRGYEHEKPERDIFTITIENQDNLKEGYRHRTSFQILGRENYKTAMTKLFEEK